MDNTIILFWLVFVRLSAIVITHRIFFETRLPSSSTFCCERLCIGTVCWLREVRGVDLFVSRVNLHQRNFLSSFFFCLNSAMAEVTSPPARVIKKTLSKYESPTSPPASKPTIEELKRSHDSDDEYGNFVEDPELKRPPIKKTLSKYGISPAIVKKMSDENLLRSRDSDEEYGNVVDDPELKRPPIKKTLSKYGVSPVLV